MHLDVNGRTYLVTGGGSGIGAAAATAIVKAGGNAVIAGRSAERLATAVKAIADQSGRGRDAVCSCVTDVTAEDQVINAVDVATAWTGTLDGVVHCAGGSEALAPVTPHRLGSMATHHRPQHQRHHVRAQAFVPRDGQRGRRRVRGHLLDRRDQYPPLVRRIRGGQIRARPSAQASRRRTRAVMVRVNGIRPGLTRTQLVAPVLEFPAVADD